VRASGDAATLATALRQTMRTLDPTLPVTVQQLAAYHTQGKKATLSWFAKGSTTTTSLSVQDPRYAQTVLPRLDGSTTTPAIGQLKSSGTFGFKIDGEWSDDTKNDSATDVSKGCVAPCGHHLRFWPVRDRAGLVVRGAYLMSMDYSGINYDYNDNVFLITNLATP
jgi:hypothetical protein